jgi:uridylate kinase
MYKRILLKLSGEQLGREMTDVETGERIQTGFDTGRAKWIAEEIRKVRRAGIEVVVTVGGGNFVRGAEIKSDTITEVEGDEAGIIATAMNAKLLGHVFNATGIPTRAMSKVNIDAFIDFYTYRRAIHDIEKKGKVVIVGGGSGQTGFTSDMGALNIAATLGCDLVVKATKVDGVYTDDPRKNPEARKLEEISYDEAIMNPKIRVMDKAAIGMAAERGIPIVVCELLKAGNVLMAARGERVGTVVR